MRAEVRKYILALAAVLLLAWLFCLPRDPFKGTPYSTVVLDRDGALLGARIADDGQWRFPPSGALPEKYSAALIQFEDRSFRFHPGFSPKAIARAVLQNAKGGRRVSGASTITMQVIRLSRHRRRTLWQKAVELVLATRLETRCTKDEILAMYASHAPFGGNVVGLEAAMWRYLGREGDDLSWAEAATFAILPNAPSSINLSQNRPMLLEKRNKLLLRLKDKGYMDEVTYLEAVDEPLIGEIHPLPSYCPHLVERINVVSHGERVLTPIDIRLQGRMEERLDYWREHLAMEGVRDLSAVVMDVKTGETVAYCGNAGMGKKRHGVWVDIARSPRSTGSILKPLLYCAALQEGLILPKSLLPDIPVNFGGFSPKNYDLGYDGAVPADEAIARSLNVPSVYLLKQYGTARFATLLRDSGLSTFNRKPTDYGLSLILGGAEACLYDLAGVYTGVVRCYLGLDGSRFSDKAAVWYMLGAMGEVGRPDRMDWRRISSLRRVAWKTGTSYGARDAWAIGLTPDYVVGVWAGNADGSPAPGLTGALNAGPVMFDIFNLLPPTGWFNPPEGCKEVEVCPSSGFLAGRFCPEKVSMMAPEAASECRTCPWHREVNVSYDGQFRVSDRSEGFRTVEMFILPPLQEKYYRIKHQDYRPLPPLRGGEDVSDEEVMKFEYPSEGAVLSAARQMDGSLPGIRCEVIHSRPDAVVYWHLDNEYLGETTDIHTLVINIPAGFHHLVAVDDDGVSTEVSVSVL